MKTKPNPNANLNGCCRQETIMATSKELTEVLGPAHDWDIDGKVKFQWTFDTPDGVASVYDYWWNQPGEQSVGAATMEAALHAKAYVEQKLFDAKMEVEREEFLKVTGHTD